MRIFILIVLILVCINIFASCSGGNMNDKNMVYKDLNDVPEQRWEQLKDKKIYFGHQSVGFNIIDGFKGIMAENSKIKLNIVETKNVSENKAGIFAHSAIGINKNPESKIEDFVQTTNTGIGKNADIAFFKFCFVDIDANTDIEKLFETYKASISSMRKKYPKTQFVHFTVPLTIIQEGIKAKIKKLIGSPIGGYADNEIRNKFNNKIRSEFQNDPIFDLALLEATYPDGKINTFEIAGKINNALIKEYTNDGGHLNPVGQKYIAGQFLLFLANL